MSPSWVRIAFLVFLIGAGALRALPPETMPAGNAAIAAMNAMTGAASGCDRCDDRCDECAVALGCAALSLTANTQDSSGFAVPALLRSRLIGPDWIAAFQRRFGPEPDPPKQPAIT